MIVSEAELKLLLNMKSATEEDLAILQVVLTEAEALVREYLHYDPVQQTHVEFYPANDAFGGLSTEFERPHFLGDYSSSWYLSPARRRQPDLQLRHLPVRRIVSIKENSDGQFGTNEKFDETEPLVEGTDFAPEFTKANLCESGSIRSCRGWCEEPGSIRVEYIAGYSPAEFAGRATSETAASDLANGVYTCPGLNAAAIKRAVTWIATKMLHTNGNLKSEGDGKGFSGGNTFQSERLQDYSYDRGSATAETTKALVSLGDDMPGAAKMALQGFVHYGIMAL